MKPFHGETLIGTITDSGPDGMGLCGFIELSSNADEYGELFAYFDDQKRDHTKEPPFPEEMLWNWFVEKDDGAREEIGLPGVHRGVDKTEIYWRYI